MGFEITTAYGIAAGTVSVLGYLAVRNRRAGWVRERQNVILDVFMAWGRANSEMAKIVQAPVTAVSTPEDLSAQLFALHTAVQRNAGITPADKPLSPALRDTLNVQKSEHVSYLQD